jgi:hypothetical protein
VDHELACELFCDWNAIWSKLTSSLPLSGFRFSLIEVKALLFMLIRNFAFAEAVRTESVIRKTSIVTRPFIKGEEAAGYQMPVLLRSLA